MPGQTYTTNLISRSTGQILASPTLAAGDVQVSTDGGSFANLATLPAVSPAGSGIVRVSLTADEVGDSTFTVRFLDQAGAEWETQYNHGNPAGSGWTKNVTVEDRSITVE